MRVINDNLSEDNFDKYNTLEKYKQKLKKKGIDVSKFVVENWLKLLNVNPVDLMNSKKICRHLWNYSMILFNGDVSACCIDFNGELIMGNIRNNAIREVWRNNKYNNFRKTFLEGNIDEIKLCRNCNEWYKYK